MAGAGRAVRQDSFWVLRFLAMVATFVLLILAFPAPCTCSAIRSTSSSFNSVPNSNSNWPKTTQRLPRESSEDILHGDRGQGRAQMESSPRREKNADEETLEKERLIAASTSRVRRSDGHNNNSASVEELDMDLNAKDDGSSSADTTTNVSDMAKVGVVAADEKLSMTYCSTEMNRVGCSNNKTSTNRRIRRRGSGIVAETRGRGSGIMAETRGPMVFQRGTDEQQQQQQQHAGRSPWPPFKFNGRLIAASVLGGVGASLAGAGGIGGGGLFVVIFSVILQFDTNTAAALSNAMVMGGSIGSFMYNCALRHPVDKRKPLIEYEIVLRLEPALLAGTSFGILVNIVSPPWLVVLLLALVLSYANVRAWRNGVRLWKAETLAAAAAPLPSFPSVRLDESGQEGDGGDRYPHAGRVEDGRRHWRDTEAAMKEPLLGGGGGGGGDGEKEGAPLTVVAALALIWAGFFLLHVIKDGDIEIGLDITPCGTWFWLLTIAELPLAILIMSFLHSSMKALPSISSSSSSSSSSSVNQPVAVNTEDGSIMDDGGRASRAVDENGEEDVAVTEGKGGNFKHGGPSALTYPLIGFLAGCLSGALGIGGGMILSPLLLEFGLLPKATQVTTAFIILFTTSMSTTQFWILGRIPGDFAVYFGILCALSFLLGLSVIARITKRYGRPSLIVFILAFVIAASAIALVVFGIWDVSQHYSQADYMGFHHLCSA